MHTLLFTLSWMSWNIGLSLIPLLCLWVIRRTKYRTVHILLWLVWFLFLPNTIYLLTDLVHLPRTLAELTFPSLSIVLVGYGALLILGFLTFWWNMIPVMRWTRSWEWWKKWTFITLLNICIAYAMVLGRFQRVNSWDVFMNPLFVVQSGLGILVSYRLLLLLFWHFVLTQGVYLIALVPWITKKFVGSMK